MAKNIKYPFIPKGRMIQYVSDQNRYMLCAKEFAIKKSFDAAMPGAAVVVKDGAIIGIAANGSNFHKKYGCKRVELKCKTGEGYDLCDGCSPKNHSESQAILNAIQFGNDTDGADLYLWGHWWCCRHCWEKMIEAGIVNVFLMENSEVLFNKDHPDNIVGKQFED